MLNQEHPPAIDLDRRWLRMYVIVLAAAFGTLYVLTRSSFPIFGIEAWIESARHASPADPHYGEPGHFLQVVLAHHLWTASDRVGVPASLEGVFVALSAGGAVAAAVFLGLIAGHILRSSAAAWTAALLFGTSLLVWTNASGELSGLPLGCVTAALFFALRGHVAWPAALWAVAVLCHVEYALAAGAFVLAVWWSRPEGTASGHWFRPALVLLFTAGAITVLALLIGSRAIGKWDDAGTLAGWLRSTYESRDDAHLDPPRALKGLLTALTVGGHYWRDIVTGRGQFDNPWFIPAAGIALLVLATIGVSLAASLRQAGAALFGLVWLLPSHVLLNWRFAPAVEKHHAAALPGFVLLVTAGLVLLTRWLPERVRPWTLGVFVLASAGLNFFGAVLPLQTLGRDTDAAVRAIRELNEQRSGRTAFVSCDDPRPVSRSGVTFLRIRSIWAGPPAEVQTAIASWARARLDEGAELYVLGRWCLPEYWATAWSKEPFDLFFLEREFLIAPTPIVDVPVLQEPVTNPFAWRTGDVFRLEPREDQSQPFNQ